MARIVAFVHDMWDVGADRIRRADPLLMGAAIAYNSLFALVPLATAFVAMLSFFDRSDSALTTVYETIAETFPPDLAVFLTDLLQESARWIGDAARSDPRHIDPRGPLVGIPCGVCDPEGPAGRRGTRREPWVPRFAASRHRGNDRRGHRRDDRLPLRAGGWSHLDRDLGSGRNRRWQCRPRHRARRSRRVGLAVVVGHLPVGSTGTDAPFGSQRWHRGSGPGGRLESRHSRSHPHSTRRRFPSSEPSASSSSGCTSSASSWSPSPRSSWPCPRQ